MRLRLIFGLAIAAAGCNSVGGRPINGSDGAALVDAAQATDGAVLADLTVPSPTVDQTMAGAMMDLSQVQTPLPACNVSVTPNMGTVNDNYTATLSSTNADSCTYQLDKNNPTAIPCNGQTQGNAALFGGAGPHMAIVTATGPGGQAQCSTSWTISDVQAPTCTVTVTPMNGKLADNYTATLSAIAATSCTYSLDNGNPVAVPCSGMINGTGQLFGGIGNHGATVLATGPGGVGSCSTGWTISP